MQLILGLVSGTTLKVSHIYLNDFRSLNEAAAKRASAERGLAGVSTGIGFLGSPQWVIGGAIALGLLEHLASTATARQASKELLRAEELASQSFELGEWVPVDSLQNIQAPDVRRWWSTSSRGARTLIHSGEAYLFVQCIEQGQLAVRLEHIALIKSDPPADLRLPLTTPPNSATESAQPSSFKPLSLKRLDSRSQLKALNAAAFIQKHPERAREHRNELLSATGFVSKSNEEGEIVLSHSEGEFHFDNRGQLEQWIDTVLVPTVTA